MTTTTMSTESVFQSVLMNYLVSQARTVESSVSRALMALLDRNERLASEVFLTEPRINEMEIVIDEHAIRLLRQGNLLAAYRALRAAEIEGAERELLRCLQAKYEGAANSSPPPILHAGCPASPAAATHQCPFNSNANGWDPNQDMLIFAVNKPTGTAVDLTVDHSEFQGDLLCSPTSTAALGGDHTAVEGGIICGRFIWGDHAQVYPLPTITNLPPGAPLPPNAPATISPPAYTSG